MDLILNHAGQQQRRLQKMFNAVSAKYDLMNRILTFGLDKRWRNIAAGKCVDGHNNTILDLYTGTGDLAIRISMRLNGQGKVIALDFSQRMLDIARRKTLKCHLENITFLEADAASLPFDNGSVNVVCIAFGLRNLTYKNPDRDRFLSEIFRVLCDMGRLVIIETSQPECRLLKWFYYRYLDIIVAGLGGWLSGDKAAYRYLALSVRNFYNSMQLKQLLHAAGFNTLTHTPMMGGIAALTIAEKRT